MHRRSFAFPLLLLALYPCEDTGLRVRPDAGTAPIEDAASMPAIVSGMFGIIAATRSPLATPAACNAC